MRRDCWERLRRPVGASRGWRQSSQLQTMTASVASLVQANVVGKFFFSFFPFFGPYIIIYVAAAATKKKAYGRYTNFYTVHVTLVESRARQVIRPWSHDDERFLIVFVLSLPLATGATFAPRNRCVVLFFPHHFNSFSPITFSSRGYINTILKIDLLFQHVTAQTGGGNIGFFF